MSIPLLPRPNCQKVLPTIYDDALSYYEEVCKLIKTVNEVITTFNSYEDIIIELQKALVDISTIETDVQSLKERVTSAESSLNSINNSITAMRTIDTNLQKQIDELVDKINSIITSYNNIINYVDNAVGKVIIENTTAWMRLENYINTQDRILQLQIDELRKAIEGMSDRVYNPVRGVRENLDDNNWDIYQDLRYGGFTNAELSEFGISNEHVASLVHNNKDLALNAKRRFKRHYLFSPVTGKEVSHANAISQLFSVLTHGLTNDEFANLDKTNDEIAQMNLTNIEKFLYYEGDNGITVGEYDNIIINNIAGILSVQGGE